MNGREDLTYVYAAAPDTRELRASLTDLPGVSGAPVSLLGAYGPDPAPAGAVAFVVSRVAPHEFDERTLKKRFEDLEWLEDVARAHHEVVQTAARHGTVLPLRLATVYQNDARARQALAAQHDVFTERIALLRDRSEFGVKLYVAPAGPSAGAPGEEADASLSPGKAYLRRRRAQHSDRETRYRYAQEAAGRVEALAARFTPHRVRHPAQSGALAGPEENVLNDAYLVPHDRADAFRTALTTAADGLDGVRVEVTGPWAPYSFAMPPPAPEAEAEPDAVRGGRAP